jgi:hypothetical protein
VKYHAWVNAEFLLEKCLVGVLDIPATWHTCAVFLYYQVLACAFNYTQMRYDLVGLLWLPQQLLSHLDDLDILFPALEV